MIKRFMCMLVAGLLIASACGGSDESSDTDASPAATQAAVADDGGCPAVPFSGLLSRSAADGHQEAQRSNSEMTHAIAVSRSDGIAYTIYLADFPISEDDLGSTLESPPGSVLVTLAIDKTEGITVGEVYASNETFYPFVIIDSGGGASDSSVGYSGQETVVGLSASTICLEIDYQDDVKKITGTVSAAIVES